VPLSTRCGPSDICNLCYEFSQVQELAGTQMDGPEEKAATLLNGGMIMVLSTLLAAFAVWLASDYLWRAVTQGTWFWLIHLFSNFLVPLVLVGIAVRGFRFGLRMMRSKASE
jgi:hypothetical protein